MSRCLFGAIVLLAAGIAPAADPELHVVSVYEGHQAARDKTKPGTAVVTVDRPGKEVVLVVHAYNFTAWEVRATAKTTIKKIIAVGYHRQHVAAPEGVKVEELTYDGKKDGVSATYIPGHYDIDSVKFRPFVRQLFDHTGLEVASFQGTYQFDPMKPFVVDAIQKDERLSSDFPKLTPAAEIPKLSFVATRITERNRLFGVFTEAGPMTEGTIQLKDAMQIVFDVNRKVYYGIGRHEFHVIDLREGTETKIPKPNGFSWPRAITFDVKRDRAIVSTRGGLFEYTPKNGAWAQLTNQPFWAPAALAWQSKTDTLYGFGVELERGERCIPKLYELNATGTVAKTTLLDSPMFPGILGKLGGIGLGAQAELIDLGAELALLVQNESRESFLYVIDPKTGKVKLAWKE